MDLNREATTVAYSAMDLDHIEPYATASEGVTMPLSEEATYLDKANEVLLFG